MKVKIVTGNGVKNRGGNQDGENGNAEAERN